MEHLGFVSRSLIVCRIPGGSCLLDCTETSPLSLLPHAYGTNTVGSHLILRTLREVGLTFAQIVQMRKPRLRPIHHLTQPNEWWLEFLPRLSGSRARTLNPSTALHDN